MPVVVTAAVRSVSGVVEHEDVLAGDVVRQTRQFGQYHVLHGCAGDLLMVFDPLSASPAVGHLMPGVPASTGAERDDRVVAAFLCAQELDLALHGILVVHGTVKCVHAGVLVVQGDRHQIHALVRCGVLCHELAGTHDDQDGDGKKCPCSLHGSPPDDARRQHQLQGDADMGLQVFPAVNEADVKR